jgi:hypothetical protein
MRDRRGRGATTVVGALAVLAVLVACGGPDGAAGGTPVDAPGVVPGTASVDGSVQVSAAVSGALDAGRHVPVRTVSASRPHLVQECRPTTRQVRRTTGVGKRRTTTYTTVRTTECESVQQGTETYRKVVSDERWCVELDNVNGHADQDRRWYRVTPDDYRQALGRSVGSPLTLRPTGEGC